MSERTISPASALWSKRAMSIVARRRSRLHPWLAAALAALWGLMLVSDFSGTGALCVAVGSDRLTTALGTQETRHPAACICRMCLGGKSGKACCCLAARTRGEGITLRALCDQNTLTPQTVVLVEVAIPSPPPLHPPVVVAIPTTHPLSPTASPVILPHLPKTPPPQNLLA